MSVESVLWLRDCFRDVGNKYVAGCDLLTHRKHLVSHQTSILISLPCLNKVSFVH